MLGIQITPLMGNSMQTWSTQAANVDNLAWNMVGISSSYTLATTTTSLTIIINSEQSDATVPIEDFTTIDQEGSISTLGARLDGNESN